MRHQRKRALRVVRLFTLLLCVPALVSLPNSAFGASTDCTISGGTLCRVTFVNTRAPETFTVPAGVTSITFDVRGAQGGDGKVSTSITSVGGKGGVDTGTLTVSPGLQLIIRVGESGTTGNSAAGGFNGGGATSATGGYLPGSGGGASDIRLSVDTVTARIVVAGGGGGASGYCYSNQAGDGGAGGGLIGNDGGYGGNHSLCWSSAYGGGGSQGAGGLQYGYTGDGAVARGSLVVGGRGTGHGDGGGGGGGGYYGGAGAGVGPGGGGSSFIDTSTARAAYVASGFLSSGLQSGPGLVTLTYANFQPAAVNISLSSAPVFRTPVNVSVNTNATGKVTFFANNKRIPGCIGLTLTGSSPTYTATCSWKPSSHGAVAISATVTPTSSHAITTALGGFFSGGLRLQVR